MGQPTLVNIAQPHDGESMSFQSQPILQMSPTQTLSSASSLQDMQPSGSTLQDIQQPMFFVSQPPHDIDESQATVYQQPQLLPMRQSAVLPMHTAAAVPEMFHPVSHHRRSGSMQMGNSIVSNSTIGSGVSQTFPKGAAPATSDPFGDLLKPAT